MLFIRLLVGPNATYGRRMTTTTTTTRLKLFHQSIARSVGDRQNKLLVELDHHTDDDDDQLGIATELESLHGRQAPRLTLVAHLNSQEARKLLATCRQPGRQASCLLGPPPACRGPFGPPFRCTIVIVGTQMMTIEVSSFLSLSFSPCRRCSRCRASSK